ncbi:hypothetical protein V9T40_003102 [Parthenolecanium corni]|uniref:Uncharacterized protein n=1 Tax=Parthenolecanium corni TaxID=536013 RepID=A0AAN9TS40_9HEMI
MSPNFRYEKNCNSKEKEDKCDTKCDVRGNAQLYQNVQMTKGVDTEQRVKYCTKARPDDCFSDCEPCRSVSSTASKADCPRPKAGKPAHHGGATGSGFSCYYKSGPSQSKCGEYKRPTPKEVAEKCYDKRPPKRVVSCHVDEPFWQHGEYVRDDCGAGIVTTKLGFHANRPLWCKTPLTTYQASHGELGRKILCGETDLTRKIHEGPPCNICEDVLPPCRGYYRKYSCDYSPCDDEVFEGGRRGPRSKIQRYWEPCATNLEKVEVSKFAPHNMALALLLRRKYGDVPCW